LFFDRFDVGRHAVLLHIQLDDIEPFDPREFASALFAE